jgi:hypothetical protein
MENKWKKRGERKGSGKVGRRRKIKGGNGGWNKGKL